MIKIAYRAVWEKNINKQTTKKKKQWLKSADRGRHECDLNYCPWSGSLAEFAIAVFLSSLTRRARKN